MALINHNPTKNPVALLVVGICPHETTGKINATAGVWSSSSPILLWSHAERDLEEHAQSQLKKRYQLKSYSTHSSNPWVGIRPHLSFAALRNIIHCNLMLDKYSTLQFKNISGLRDSGGCALVKHSVYFYQSAVERGWDDYRHTIIICSELPIELKQAITGQCYLTTGGEMAN